MSSPTTTRPRSAGWTKSSCRQCLRRIATLTWLRDLPRGLPKAVVRSALTSIFVEIESRKERDAAGKPVKVLGSTTARRSSRPWIASTSKTSGS